MITVMKGVSFFQLNGRMTNATLEQGGLVKNKIQYAFTASNYWSSSEYNQNNAWNVNFNSGNVNNNNKYNSNVARAVAALDEKRKEAWVDAFDDCCRHKMGADNCIIYRIIYEYDIMLLAAEVESGEYMPSTSTCFCVTRPKLREVFAANFRDRVVHHWLMMKLNPLFEERFVKMGNVSFNCRKGFGVQSAVNALKRDICEISKGYREDAYVGRFDIVGFFMSIDKKTLKRQLEWFIYEKYNEGDVDLVYETLCKVIDHNPASDCEKRGNVGLFAELDPKKSLFCVEEGKGLPIGNLTSQILANFYLSFFDAEMVRWTKERGGKYERFVDDFAVVMPTAKTVVEAYMHAKEWLMDNLLLKLHDDKVYIQHYTKGIKFVGYVVKMDRVYLSNRTFGHFEEHLVSIERLCERRERGLVWELNKRISSLNSYVGFTCHTSCYGKRMATLAKYRKIYKYAYLKGRTHVVKLKNKYKKGEMLYEKDRMERTRMSSAVRNAKKRRDAATYHVHRRTSGKRRKQ